VFTDWSQLAQQLDEESLKFSSRVRELALHNKNSGQPYTEASQCLAFLRSLNSNFNHFSQDYFSGCSDIRLTTLATITSQTQSLQRTFTSKVKIKTFGSTSTPIPAAAVLPESPPLHLLSETALLDLYVKKNKCPIHQMDNHTMAECGFLRRHGFRCISNQQSTQKSLQVQVAMSVSHQHQPHHQFSLLLWHLPSQLLRLFQPHPQRSVVPRMRRPCPRSPLHRMMMTSVSAVTSSVPRVALTPLLAKLLHPTMRLASWMKRHALPRSSFNLPLCLVASFQHGSFVHFCS
jgi:hypothetical protein